MLTNFFKATLSFNKLTSSFVYRFSEGEDLGTILGVEVTK